MTEVPLPPAPPVAAEVVEHPCPVPPSEVVQSLTGFEELGIEKEFDGLSLAALKERDSIRFLRALVFVHRRREGDRSGEAYQHAMNLALRDVIAYFPDEGDEEVAEESGKG